MEDDVVIPDGLLNTNDALSSMHIISNMIGSERNRNARDILKKLRVLGFSDETSFYLLWYVMCVLYQELEDITEESFNIVEKYGARIEDLLVDEDIPAFAESLRMILFSEDSDTLGDMKRSWREHWGVRYRKHFAKKLDNYPTHIPYYEDDIDA